MTNVSCAQCGSLNLMAAEHCQQCGAELHYLTPAGNTATFSAPANEYAQDGQEEFKRAPFIGRFDGVGAVLSPTITLFKDNFWLITKIVFLIFAPFEIFKALSLPDKTVNWQAAGVAFCLWLFCKMLVAPSLVFALVTVMRTGTAPTVNEAYRFGLSKIGTLVVTALLAWTLEVLGFICLIIPGIILSLAFEIIYPIVALENLSPVETLKRSYNLTRGYKGSIFVAGFVFALLLGVVNIPVTMLTASLPASGGLIWLPKAAGALISDILSEATIVLSLVIYFSILRGPSPLMPQQPPPPPSFQER